MKSKRRLCEKKNKGEIKENTNYLFYINTPVKELYFFVPQNIKTTTECH